MTPHSSSDSTDKTADASNSTSSHSHNPFYIGSLPDLSLSRSRSRRSESQERAKQEKAEEKEKRRSKRRSLINAGRSLSPFRYHRSKRDSQADNEEKEDLNSSVATLKGEGDNKSVKSTEESDSERDSNRKWGSRLCPRNNAFNPMEPDDDEDFVPRARPVRKGTGWTGSSSSKGKEGGGKTAASGSNEAVSTTTSSSSLDLPKESSESIGRPSVDSVRSVDTYDSSILSESDKEKGTNPKDGEESDEDSESTSSELSFDPELLDNTLFNAGCLDLHGAWQAGGTTSSRPSSIYGGTDMERGDSHQSNNDPNSSGLPGTSRPSAYDSLWGPGAGKQNEDLIQHELDLGPDNLEAPNVVLPSAPLNAHSIGHTNARTFEQLHEHSPIRSSSPSRVAKSSSTSEEKSTAALQALSKQNQPPQDPSHALTASRPLFERNRCTITLIHGEYEKKAKTSKRPKRYIVASDGSEEASYAIEWCIGTVLRDGDETLIVSVMETDTKLDAIDPAHEDRNAKMEHQKVRQSMALVLARQATALLQRTRLGVKISCQALHSKNARHMLLDMIDFFAPTLVIVGSRGLSALKGILLGSTSHYLVQKSSVPVMVARKRLKLPALPRVRRDVVESVRARHMRLDEAAIEKESKVEEKVDEEGKTKDDTEGEQKAGEGKGEGDESESKDSALKADGESEKSREKSSEDSPTSPEQIAERVSQETNPISPPMEDSNDKSSAIAPPLDHSITPSLQTQDAEKSQNQLEPSRSIDSTTDSVTHLAQDQEAPQRGRSMKQAKD